MEGEPELPNCCQSVSGRYTARMAHDTTPMGSTTKLVVEKKPRPRYCPSLTTGLVAMSLSFSLANIVRLPRMVYLHGGGTFLLTYVIITIIFGIPLAFLEIVLGQFCQQGTTKLWRAVPLLKGVGYVKLICSFLLAMYYPVIMAISLFYGLWTMRGPPPFHECTETANDIETIRDGQECLSETFLKPPDLDPMWFGVNLTLLFLLWAFVMLCVCRGVKSYRISALLLLLPLIGSLIALLVNQFMESSVSLHSLVQFGWAPLKSFDTWYYAVIQFFFSTQIGFGNIVTCSGNIYSKSNAFWTAVFYIICNVLVGIGAVCLVYIWIEHLDENNISISTSQVEELFVLTLIYDVASQSLGSLAQIWASISYLLIILAGFTSMVALIYTIAVCIVVETKNKWRSWLISAGICAVGFVFGIAIMLPANLRVLHMLDYYVIGRMVAMTTALELVGFLWIYGIKALCNDFEFVLGHKLSPLWNIIWFTTPIFLVVIEVCSLFMLPVNGENGRIDKQWVYLSGWILYGLMWLVIITMSIWQISGQVDYNLGQKFLSSLKPSRNWGPVDPIYRHGWVQWRDQYQTTGERDFTLKRRGTRDYTHSVKTEARYNTMGTTPPYVVQVPDGLDFSDHVCWRRDPNTLKKGKT